jgi:hypothetical protein
MITVTGKSFEPTVSIANSPGAQDDILVVQASDQSPQASNSLKTIVDRPAIGAHFDSQLIQELPLGIPRSVDSLALLLPGVAPAAQTVGANGPRVSSGLGSAGEFSAEGLRGTANNFLIDGTDNNDENVCARREGYLIPGSQIVEDVASFAVATALYDSRYGKAPGAQVDSSSLSGGSKLHLTAYGLLSDQRFNALNYFDGLVTHGSQPLTVGNRPVWVDSNPRMGDAIGPTRSPDSELTTGAVLSGAFPGLRDTFFASSFEFDRIRKVQRLNFSVPTLPERGFLGTGATGLPISGENSKSYPAGLAGDAFFSLYPFPNNPVGPYGPNTYTRDRPANADGLQASQRLDRTLHFARASFLGLRYSYTNSGSQIPSTGGALDSGLNVQSQTQSFTGFLSSTPRSYLANTLRFSWGTARFRFLGDREPSLILSDLFPGDDFLLNARYWQTPLFMGRAPSPSLNRVLAT